MDTREVAERIGTTPRQLRQFLRSGHSTFVPVGSGARYEFTDREIPTILRRFTDWLNAGRPRPVATPKPSSAPVRSIKSSKQHERDSAVWAEEETQRALEKKPSIAEQLGDIRDPRVRQRALADAHAAEERLMLRLMAIGLHVTQLGDLPRNGKK